MARSDAATLVTIRRLLDGRTPELEHLGVASLSIFGSCARDEARPESDIDVLVDFRGGATLSKYVELKAMLEALFDRPVDLVTRKGLRESLRAAVEKDAIRVA